MIRKLLLFDVDGTLLDTGGAGGASLLDAAEEVLGAKREDLPPLDLAGATDGAVVRKLFADAGCELEPGLVGRFRASYLRHLERRLHGAAFAGRLLLGVSALLARMAEESCFAVGLLTGNIRHGAHLKLQRFGIAGHFADGGFGDDSEHRNELGPVAVSRMEQIARRSFHPQDVIVIGDTPRDIACAHAMGARCLAVATGRFDHAALSMHNSWMVLQDLSDTGRILALLAE